MSSKRSSAPLEGESIYRIPPYYYIHVLDQNTNVTKVEVGPKTFIRQDNEKVERIVSHSLIICVVVSFFTWQTSWHGQVRRLLFLHGILLG